MAAKMNLVKFHEIRDTDDVFLNPDDTDLEIQKKLDILAGIDGDLFQQLLAGIDDQEYKDRPEWYVFPKRVIALAQAKDRNARVADKAGKEKKDKKERDAKDLRHKQKEDDRVKPDKKLADPKKEDERMKAAKDLRDQKKEDDDQATAAKELRDKRRKEKKADEAGKELADEDKRREDQQAQAARELADIEEKKVQAAEELAALEEKKLGLIQEADRYPWKLNDILLEEARQKAEADKAPTRKVQFTAAPTEGEKGMMTTAGMKTRTRQPCIPEHTGIYKLHLQAQATLGTAGIRQSVELPPGIRQDEWIAAQMIGVSEEIEMIVSLLEDFCNKTCCPTMSAGKRTSYSWACETHKEPKAFHAMEYMDMLVDYANKTLSNEDVVPTDGRPFPREFLNRMKQLLKRFFRVYAHLYLHHFAEIVEHGCEAHVNCCFKHFLFFVNEFHLVTEEEMNPLMGLVNKFLKPSGYPSDQERRALRNSGLDPGAKLRVQVRG